MEPQPEICVFFIALKSQVSEIVQETVYIDPSLENEGFIHFCSYHQVKAVVGTFYPGVGDLQVLIVDVSLLDAELRYEAPVGDAIGDISKDALFPHLYGPLNVDAIIDVVEFERFVQQPVHPDTVSLLRHYRFERLPVEGTLFKSTWRSMQETAERGPSGTAMVGLYANVPESISCFHKLDYDEVWHVYGGDSFTLYLLYPDGKTEEILMGSNPIDKQHVQYVIPAGVWQAGCLNEGGRYALFGCTMAPGFTGTCFEAGLAADLTKLYPTKAKVIEKLSINGHHKTMPKGFAT
jgi:predicted cupin superfamily sugar epimerase/uncharacterized protein (DUF952 family)